MQDENMRYDVFVLPLYEDRDGFINELVLAICRNGLNIWLSSDETARYSIAYILKEALVQCNRAIILLNGKETPVEELSGLLTGDLGTFIIPVLHNSPAAELRKLYPAFTSGNLITSRRGVEHTAGKIIQALHERNTPGNGVKKKRKKDPNEKGMILLGRIISNGNVIG